MPDETTKQKSRRAKDRAMEHLRESGYQIIRSDNETFCFVATRRREIRFIRVVIDEITPLDRKLAKSVPAPPECSREIFCYRSGKFEIEELNPVKY